MNDEDTGFHRKDPQEGGDFQERLRRAKEEDARRRGRDRQQGLSGVSPIGVAFRIGTELVAALMVGVGIGYVLDKWFGTSPWLLIVFFFLGSGAGIMNVYRAASGIGLAPGYGTPGKPPSTSAEESAADQSAPGKDDDEAGSKGS